MSDTAPVKEEAAKPVEAAPTVDLSAEFGTLADAQEEGTDVEIAHPKTGEPLGITIRVAGPDSKRQKTATASIIQERGDLKLRKISQQRMDDESNRIAAASIITWSGVVIAGKAVEYSPQNAFKLVTAYPFIREQIVSTSGDRANFLKK